MELVPIVFTILIYSFGCLLVVLLLSVVGNKLFVTKVEVPLSKAVVNPVDKRVTYAKTAKKKSASEYREVQEKKRIERERFERKERTRILNTKERNSKQKELKKKIKESDYHKRFVVINQLEPVMGREVPSRERLKKTFYPVVISQYKTNVAPNYKIESH